MNNPLDGQIALITGASRGIGHAIMLELARSGATVIGTATSEEGIAHIDSALKQTRSMGKGMVLDVRDQSSVDSLMSQVKSEFGGISILVNNAGVTHDTLLMAMKDEDWTKVIDTDLNSVYRLSRACIRAMIKQRHGRIINIASVVAASGNPGQCNYSAAKAGMIGFSKSLSREVGSRGITVNVVAPGFIDTDMTRSLKEEQRNVLIEQIPLHRLGQTQDIAHAVAFLASPYAGYITGETLHVNGGMYMA